MWSSPIRCDDGDVGVGDVRGVPGAAQARLSTAASTRRVGERGERHAGEGSRTCSSRAVRGRTVHHGHVRRDVVPARSGSGPPVWAAVERDPLGDQAKLQMQAPVGADAQTLFLGSAALKIVQAVEPLPFGARHGKRPGGQRFGFARQLGRRGDPARWATARSSSPARAEIGLGLDGCQLAAGLGTVRRLP